MNNVGDDTAHMEGEDTTSASTENDRQWLKLANDAYRQSTSYYDAALRGQAERNISAFHSRHPPGSKYNSDAYKYRSKIYRPKTRSMLRRGEAAGVTAFFATSDVLSITAEDQDNPAAEASAELQKEVTQLRLKKSIPWFCTLLGAYQDAGTQGVCISHEYWCYSESDKTDQLTGKPIVREDKPVIELVPFENFRIHPAASWIDPVSTTPYIIELIPMYVYQCLERMNSKDTKTGQPDWSMVTADELRQSVNNSYDSVRQARQNRGQDPTTLNEDNQFNLVWIHRCIVHADGEDWFYYTLGEQKLISKPVPLKEVYFHGRRPYTVGFINLETHKVYKQSKPEMLQGLQQEANDIANQRLDNVKQVLNKRYFVRREGADVDMAALTRNVPGGAVLMRDPTGDVRLVETPDVTGSSYHEQDRINLDFDELAGMFSNSSVNSNRKTNETVGGMVLMSNDANQITEYELRVFAETWVKPVLSKVVAMVREYETDEVILRLAGQRAKLWREFNLEQVTPDMLSSDVELSINVGFGSTNPDLRMARIVNSVSTVVRILGPQAAAKLKTDELIKEVMSAAGYDTGGRFFEAGDDQQYEMLTEQIQQLQAALESKQGEEEMKTEDELKVLEAKHRQEMEKMRYQRQLEVDPNASFSSNRDDALQQIAQAVQQLQQQTVQAFGQISQQIQETDQKAQEAIAISTEVANFMMRNNLMTDRHNSAIGNMQDALSKILDRMTAPKIVHHDKDGKPIAVEIVGHETRPIEHDAKGRIQGVV